MRQTMDQPESPTSACRITARSSTSPVRFQNRSAVDARDRRSKGNIEPLKLPTSTNDHPRVSQRWQASRGHSPGPQQDNVWTYDLSGVSTPRRLTFGGTNRFPIWSSDSQRVAFQSNREGDSGISGSVATERSTTRLTENPTQERPMHLNRGRPTASISCSGYQSDRAAAASRCGCSR